MFWLVAAVLVVLVGVPILRALTRRDAAPISPAVQDMSIYKDQIDELDRDVARGVVNAAEAKDARTEIARRLLAADKRAANEDIARGASKPATYVAIGAVALVLLGAVGLYTSIGAPGMKDQPLQDRIAAVQDTRRDQLTAEQDAPTIEVEAEAEHEALVAQLRDAVAKNPTDETGLRLLVDNEAQLGNFKAARAAQEQLMSVLGDGARPSDYTDLGEIMVLAAGGYVSPQAENALVKALNKNPRDPRARYYSGLALAQTGRPDVAYRMWAGLLEESDPNAPWVPLIQSQIGQVARAAGISLSTQTLPGPSAQDVENAATMTPEDRRAMIQGMVGGLADQLATEGGTPTQWARLIRSYGVLGETGNANTIWQEAKETFKDNPEAMMLLREAARAAKIIN